MCEYDVRDSHNDLRFGHIAPRYMVVTFKYITSSGSHMRICDICLFVLFSFTGATDAVKNK